MYVTVTLAQELTRDGFDPRVHTFSNGLLTGVLMVLFAVGASRVLYTGRFAAWGPRLLGLYGAAIIIVDGIRRTPVPTCSPGRHDHARHRLAGAEVSSSRPARTAGLTTGNSHRRVGPSTSCT
ncbi:DUF998 domain-containing protein [Amycolatopsis pigmentata]|uniref:DUF998 domain-containing protein n=1 Tax=Amycolatopsis pigmentata TaxID=450801 RepID=A0ABW5FWH3_9PSEU